ncbi:hypothetical protein EJ06DRAFT_519509 [Trichodelitschia bisporula]|uniref:Uncharacterized protein n=1 Tax=Trichodelitschia bisporula TaxID=703511 RepID=A0A6G1I6J1_9PEZI|nr:hypothetical protein EJ06DRAFT_519509 [Trichodelitschia bisporula]
MAGKPGGGGVGLACTALPATLDGLAELGRLIIPSLCGADVRLGCDKNICLQLGGQNSEKQDFIAPWKDEESPNALNKRQRVPGGALIGLIGAAAGIEMMTFRPRLASSRLGSLNIRLESSPPINTRKAKTVEKEEEL